MQFTQVSILTLFPVLYLVLNFLVCLLFDIVGVGIKIGIVGVGIVGVGIKVGIVGT